MDMKFHMATCVPNWWQKYETAWLGELASGSCLSFLSLRGRDHGLVLSGLPFWVCLWMLLICAGISVLHGFLFSFFFFFPICIGSGGEGGRGKLFVLKGGKVFEIIYRVKRGSNWEVGLTFHKILTYPLEMLAFSVPDSPASVPAAGNFAMNPLVSTWRRSVFTMSKLDKSVHAKESSMYRKSNLFFTVSR